MKNHNMIFFFVKKEKAINVLEDALKIHAENEDLRKNLEMIKTH